MPSSANNFFGWLGRQVGHVKKAVKPLDAGPKPQVIYRSDKIEEQEMPDQPGMKLRRTVIDEVIVEDRLLENPTAHYVNKPDTEKPGTHR
ncbi:MAG TPA: hypothetical protein VFC78_07785 [Tepidisphaeraceae bacterium]|nr:hypothetical protein [Tepidisphaeraceae bacterium]